MDEQQNIQPMQSDFERIRKETADGKEYWSARELSNVMGYSTWQKFNRVLNKALQVAQSRGMNISEHFNQAVEMAKVGSGTFRKVDNCHLTRLASMGHPLVKWNFAVLCRKILRERKILLTLPQNGLIYEKKHRNCRARLYRVQSDRRREGPWPSACGHVYPCCWK